MLPTGFLSNLAALREVFSDRDLDGLDARGPGAAGVGGMATKIEAARIAAAGGVRVVVTAAERAAGALNLKEARNPPTVEAREGLR